MVLSNGGSRAVPVRLSVSRTLAEGGDVGPVYVIAIDATTRDSVVQSRAVVDDGYAFQLSLDPGRYELIAGTDMDDNGFLGDEGEAYGAFPLTSTPKVLTVTAPSSGIEFPVRFEFALGRTAARHARPAKPKAVR
jgi:serine protease